MRVQPPFAYRGRLDWRTWLSVQLLQEGFMWRVRQIMTVAVMGASLIGVTGQASAETPRRTGDYSWQSTSPDPRRGYEGWIGTGRRTRYCSYYRVPNRECDRRGCRVTSWTMHQSCH